MLDPLNFQLPLEKEYRLQVIRTEIDECGNVGELKAQLKRCAESLMRFQHLASQLAEQNLKHSISHTFGTIISKELGDGNA